MNNIFKILKIGKKELYHNRMLDYLFKLNDGQNDFVLNLLNELGIKAPTIKEVRSEYIIEDESEEKWRRPDFIIITDKEYIVIENKVRMSSINHQQLEEENKFGRYQASLKELLFKMILITPKNITGPTLDIVNNLKIHSLSWPDILHILEATYFDEDLSLLINEYIEHWEDDILISFKGFDLEVMNEFENIKKKYINLSGKMKEMLEPFYRLIQEKLIEILEPEHTRFNYTIHPTGDWIRIRYYRSSRTYFEYGINPTDKEDKQWISLELENANIRQEIYEALKKNEKYIKSKLGDVDIEFNKTTIIEFLPVKDINDWEEIIDITSQKMKVFIETLKPILDKLDMEELEPVELE